MKKYPYINKSYDNNGFSFGSNLCVKLFLVILFCQTINSVSAQNYAITEAKISQNRTDMATRAMQPNFWLNPVDDANIGKVCYAFGSYYRGVDTAIADKYILELNSTMFIEATPSTIYFQTPILLRFLLDERFSKNMSTAAKNHLLKQFYDVLKSNDYLDSGVWNVYGSENHNAIKKSVDYLAALAFSKTALYKDVLLADGTNVANHITVGAKYWRDYFLSRAQKGLEIEIHSATYSKYTLQCYYNLLDLTEDVNLKKRANLYLHLYWADIAQHFMPANDVVGGASTRTYKADIYKLYLQYPRSHTAQFGWTTVGVSQHPGNFIELITHYRVPDVVSKIALLPKSTNFLLTNKSWGAVGTGKSTINDPAVILFNTTNGSGSVLRQSYVTDRYVMGTTLYDIQKAYTNIAAQNRAMGVYFSHNENDRILINGKSRVVNGQAKGYNDVTGITGKNCLVSWRPSNYDTSYALGMRIFVNTRLYTNGVMINGWWFSQVATSFVAMRPANLSWTWVPETDTGTTGGYFELADPDSPIIIECAKNTDYVDFVAFQNDILNNSFSFASNVLRYTSSAGEAFTVYRKNSTAYPRINGTDVSFNPQFTYNSQYLKGIDTTDPFNVNISYLGENLKLDFQNNTETYNATLSIEDFNHSKAKIAIYPNPSTSGLFNINSDLPVETPWEVYSLLGTKVSEGNTPLINLSGNSKGIYILKIDNTTVKLIYN